MLDAHAAALEYAERGWSIIPMRPDTKRPYIEWKEYQQRIASEEEINEWFAAWPDALLGVVTGAISGIVIVDADSEEADQQAHALGFTRTPTVVRTKRGKHYYFAHPRDGKWRGPRAGNNVRQTNPDWPRVDGLDFRGDGSYALLPPSKNYVWSGFYPDELPTWRDWLPEATGLELTLAPETSFDFSRLDLSDVSANDGWVSEWDRTAAYVRERYPNTLKLPSGSGNSRNGRVLSYASECVLLGAWGEELRAKVRAFMHEFFVEDLPTPEFEATCTSVENMERRNHPERFDAAGNYIFTPLRAKVADEKAVTATPKRRLIYAKDAEDLVAAAASRSFFIEPWLRKNTINQVYGYSGHGKSLVTMMMLYALAAGARSVGPFEIPGPARVLYFDYENGAGTLGARLLDATNLFGDTFDRLGIWTPFLQDGFIDLKTSNGLLELQGWIEYFKPDVVVIDTLRTAFSGLEEKDAAAWAPINKLALALRNAGLTVIMMHHSNKPSDSGLGGEAGSSNQLTTLETQLRIAQVFDSKEMAKTKGGLFDGDYERPVWPMLQDKLPSDAILNMVVELRYGKVREWSELHDPVQWMGFGVSLTTGQPYIVSSASTKQKARALLAQGYPVTDIAATLRRPTRVVSGWLAPPEP
jgi:hypothetical protein